MKKAILILTAAVLLCTGSSCMRNAAESLSTTSPPTAQTESAAESVLQTEIFTKATITVRDAQDALLPQGQYDTFVAEQGEMQTRILFSTDAPVRDFCVLSLSDGTVDADGNMHFSVQKIYEQPRLTPDRPLEVTTVFYGLIPNNGISYVDETGLTRCFAVDMSGEDGSLYLWEFE